MSELIPTARSNNSPGLSSSATGVPQFTGPPFPCTAAPVSFLLFSGFTSAGAAALTLHLAGQSPVTVAICVGIIGVATGQRILSERRNRREAAFLAIADERFVWLFGGMTAATTPAKAALPTTATHTAVPAGDKTDSGPPDSLAYRPVAGWFGPFPVAVASAGLRSVCIIVRTPGGTVRRRLTRHHLGEAQWRQLGRWLYWR
ncbi:MAG: hypothetical protein WA888_02075 [Burkholderiaceae bacterium]